MTKQFWSRRQFCKALGVGLVGLGLPGCASPGRKRAIERPNFIIIFCDDMGYADIGPFGAEGYFTPNLDRMAAEGMVFTDFHVRVEPIRKPPKAESRPVTAVRSTACLTKTPTALPRSKLLTKTGRGGTLSR